MITSFLADSATLSASLRHERGQEQRFYTKPLQIGENVFTFINPVADFARIVTEPHPGLFAVFCGLVSRQQIDGLTLFDFT